MIKKQQLLLRKPKLTKLVSENTPPKKFLIKKPTEKGTLKKSADVKKIKSAEKDDAGISSTGPFITKKIQTAEGWKRARGKS